MITVGNVLIMLVVGVISGWLIAMGLKYWKMWRNAGKETTAKSDAEEILTDATSTPEMPEDEDSTSV